MSIDGKLILITGASSGIGEATAKKLAILGAKVILQARSIDKLENISSDIKASKGIAYTYPCDLTKAEEVKTVSNQIKQEIGVPDILILSAGAGNWTSIFQTEMEEFDKMMSTPYFSTVYIVKAYLNDLVRRNSGHIITINSAASYFSFPGALGYLSTRWALRGFSEGLYEDFKSTNILVSSIVSGKVDSPYFSVNPISENRIPKIATGIMKTLSTSEVADHIIKVVEHPKKTTIIPRMMAISIFFNQWFPRLFKILMRKTGYKGIPKEILQIRKA
ncbi:MAG: SDR family NAD(P)-dependent oxidoreductase [Cyclobacteriaceae bacterium]